MTQQSEAEEYGRCVRCGRYSWSEVLCAGCLAAAERESEVWGKEASAMLPDLPRIVWQAQWFRLVQYLDEEHQRIVLGLERRDGADYLGQERWMAVSASGGPDGWGWVCRDWCDAFEALSGCLFTPGGERLPLPLIADDADDAQYLGRCDGCREVARLWERGTRYLCAECLGLSSF